MAVAKKQLRALPWPLPGAQLWPPRPALPTMSGPPAATRESPSPETTV